MEISQIEVIAVIIIIMALLGMLDLNITSRRFYTVKRRISFTLPFMIILLIIGIWLLLKASSHIGT